MNIMWLGTASLFLETAQTRIVFDPFLEMPFREAEYKTGIFHQANHVFVTHGHFDHISHIKKLYRNDPVRIHCTKTPMKTLMRDGLPEWYFHEICPGDSFSIGDFQISIFKAKHCRFDSGIIIRKLLSRRTWRHAKRLFQIAGLNWKYPENGEMILFDIHADQAHIQILGSMGLDPDTTYPTGADILVLALQGRSDQDVYALSIVERLRPKRVLLYHYDDAFCPVSEDVDTSAFVQNVKVKFDIPCMPMKKYRRFKSEEL